MTQPTPSHHNHSHAAASFNRAFAWGIGLNAAFVAVEASYGFTTNSLALLADASHNLSDVAGLILAWVGAWAQGLRPDARHTYGWQRASILAAVLNAVVLLLAMGSLGWEALGRLRIPQATNGDVVMAVAAVGIVINGATAWLFMRAGSHDLNLRAAFVHMAADALVSLGVVVAGALYLWLGWNWIDPVVSLLIAVLVVGGTWALLRQSLHLMFDGVPADVELAEVRLALLDLPEVQSVHDLHVWAMGTSEIALTAHLVLHEISGDASGVLQRASRALHDGFGIHHATLQLESAEYAGQCALRCGEAA